MDYRVSIGSGSGGSIEKGIRGTKPGLKLYNELDPIT